MSGAYYYVFMMIGKNDNPLFEIEFSAAGAKKDTTQPESQFIIHAALDMVDECVWKNPLMYLKVVDKYNEKFMVSAFVTAGHVRFMMLHTTKNEDGIKNFFQDVYELYLKHLLNPFNQVDTQIKSTAFHKRVKRLGKRYLT